jgi:hypothetical protein
LGDIQLLEAIRTQLKIVSFDFRSRKLFVFGLTPLQPLQNNAERLGQPLAT